MQLLIAKYFSRRDGTSDLYVAKENAMPNFASWMLPHDAPYKSHFDRSILRVTEVKSTNISLISISHRVFIFIFFTPKKGGIASDVKL